MKSCSHQYFILLLNANFKVSTDYNIKQAIFVCFLLYFVDLNFAWLFKNIWQITSNVLLVHILATLQRGEGNKSNKQTRKIKHIKTFQYETIFVYFFFSCDLPSVFVGDDVDQTNIIVSSDDFTQALQSLVPSVSQGELERYKEIREKFTSL